jgi:glyceraldehyde 3-phosphate dehydrogenase
MPHRVAINGFGRIGRQAFRVLQEREDCEVVAVNDLASAKDLWLLLKYDSVYGRFKGDVRHEEGALVVEGRRIPVHAEKDPTKLPWRALEVDVVLESTGVFRKRSQLQMHVDAGAKRVVLSAPAKDELDATVVIGVNEDVLRPEHRIVSNASCTTNCCAPMAKVLNEAFGVRQACMTTIHAFTNDQHLVDAPHPKDPRRARAAGTNIIPTTTGAAKAVGLVYPQLRGRIDGTALRVPVAAGSLVELNAIVEKNPTADEVNAAFRAAAAGPMKGIVSYCEDPIVSYDIVGDPHSCVFDAMQTVVMGGDLVGVYGWYDNEWGYSCRVVELLARVAALGAPA